MIGLDEMADRFPPVEMTFPEALEQSRCGRMIGRERWGSDPFDTPTEPLTRADINADDWIITG